MLGACALLVLGGRAGAEPARVRHASLSVSAEAGCATGPALAARVRAPGWQLELAPQPAAELSLSVEVHGAGEVVQARLEVRWPDGHHALRELAAHSCSAALDALALLIGMTLDTAQAQPRPRSQPGGARGGTAARSGDEAPRGAVREAAESRERPGSGERVAAESGEPAADGGDAIAARSGAPAAGQRDVQAPGGETRAEPPEPDGLAIAYGSIGLLAALGSGAAPQLEPGLGLYASLALRGSGWLRPLLQLELAHAWDGDVRAQGGRADFSWDGGQLSLCPLGLRRGALAGHACGALELARVRASGHDAYQPRSVSRPWASAGLALRGSLAVSWLELQLGAALLHPLWRDRFAFAQDVFHTVPAWRFQLLLGLGIRFP